jgi:hypothetical protein
LDSTNERTEKLFYAYQTGDFETGVSTVKKLIFAKIIPPSGHIFCGFNCTKTIAMMFVTFSPKQEAKYGYMCVQLRKMADNMYGARKALERLANASFDKSFARCVYLLTSESLQCENEIHAQIDSLNCSNFSLPAMTVSKEGEKMCLSDNINGLEALCKYCEDTYLNWYKQLLHDKHLASSVKRLIQKQSELFMHSITQLRLFLDVKPFSFKNLGSHFPN